MKPNRFWVALAGILLLAGCIKQEILIPPPPGSDNGNTGTSGSTTTVSANVSAFTSMTFDVYDWEAPQYFSTFDTSFKSPLWQYSMTPAQLKNVDLMYIYNSDWQQPGFIDPLTASVHQYWDDYYSPWMDSSVQTNFYITTLTVENFDSVKSNPSLLRTYFADSTKIRLAPNAVFPLGTCIGGRQSAGGIDPVFGMDTQFKLDEVFGFKNVTSGKLGLIHISPNQESSWPVPLTDHNTVVDIVKEK